MEKTNHATRMELSEYLNDTVWKIDHAELLLRDVHQQFFSGMKQERLYPQDAESVGRLIMAAADILWDVLAEIRPLVGDTKYRGAKAAMETAKLLLDSQRVDELHFLLADKMRLAKGPNEKATRAEIDRISRLPDAEAIPQLEALLAK